MLSYIPAARNARQVDVCKDYINRRARITEVDGLFATGGLQNDITRVTHAGGNIASHKQFVLYQENDQSTGVTNRGYRHDTTFATKLDAGLDSSTAGNLF